MSESDNAGEDSSNKVTLDINGLDKTTVQYIIKKSTPLGKMMKNYAMKKGLDLTELRFMYDQVRIHEHSTCKELNIPSGSEIDIVQRQDGGVIIR